ncbi:MAG TPA: regulatory iron-sulfur-containing complex subunit RicT [Armatimonadota bacterium]|jgi:cell fate regulator YaaT (PSP1 superfamily)
MRTAIGVTFEPSGPIQFFLPGDVEAEIGDSVLVDTAAGPRVAKVTLAARETPDDALPSHLHSVMRVATPEDMARNEANHRLEERARGLVPQKIAALDLPMKLIDVDADWDGARITVFFAAEGRVDFRELVRVLASAMGVRVQMHQLGARDHAKMIGGLASCGREICCSSWMQIFEPVSMRMAKEQSLFLNPSKFSGNCGKLKCCLRYEYEFYSEAHDGPPIIGEEFETALGSGRVVEIDAAQSVARVEVPEHGLVEVKLKVRVEPSVEGMHEHACENLAD